MEDPNSMGFCSRRIGKERKQIPQPEAIANYNNFMNGVDVHDQLRAKYPYGRASKKYWRYLQNFIIDCCRVNAWILYRDTYKPGKKFTCKDFIISVGK